MCTQASDSTIDASKTGEQDYNSAPMSESSISHASYEDITDGQIENPTHKGKAQPDDIIIKTQMNLDVGVQVPEVALNQDRIPQVGYGPPKYLP